MPSTTATINAAAIALLIENRHGMRMHYREVYKRLTRRTTMFAPAQPIRGGYRRNGVSWPLTDYLAIEAYLLKLEPAQLSPISDSDLLFLRGLGRLQDAAADIAAAAQITDDIRNSLPQPA